jgi:hypothetical protein
MGRGEAEWLLQSSTHYPHNHSDNTQETSHKRHLGMHFRAESEKWKLGDIRNFCQLNVLQSC